MKRFLLVLVSVIHLVLVDAVTKEIAAAKFAEAVSVIPGFFDLALVRNYGCAWGMFQGQVWPLALFGMAAMAVLVWKRRDFFGEGRLAAVCEVLMYAGIAGNLIDRVFRGYVIDFLDFHWYSHHFPCFNLADSFICIAAGLMILMSFRPSASGKK